MKLDSKMFNEIIQEAIEGARSHKNSMHPQQELYARRDPQLTDPHLAKFELQQAASAATKIEQMIKDGEIFDELIHTKISRASDYLTSVLHYLEYQEKRGER